MRVMRHYEHMTVGVDGGQVPPLTLGWRLKMALGEITVGDMADRLGYSRAQLSRWMADKGAPPRRGVITQWALATGVSRHWLLTGEMPEDGEGCAIQDSNLEPTDLQQTLPGLRFFYSIRGGRAA